MEEIWKDVAIEPWGEIYQVSNFGNIRSKVRTFTRIHPMTGKLTEFRGKSGLMKPHVTQKGYLRINLGKNGNKFLLHRLIMITFGSAPTNDKMQVNHKDGNKLNNHIDNLEWVTNQQNIVHAYKNNLIKVPKGEYNATAKKVLQIDINTDEVVKEWACLSYIKRDLNFQTSSISNVCHGKKKTAHGFKWKYV